MNKETIKEFLKPGWKKILMLVFFMAISLLFVWSSTFPGPPEFHESGYLVIVDFYTIARGWPLPYLTINIGGGITQGFSIFYLGLVIDLFFWYLISCLIIFVYNKLRRKKA